MAKSLILFLNSWLIAVTCFGQSSAGNLKPCDCSVKKLRDSLTEKYIDKGADRYSYNSPEFQACCDSLIAICPNIAVAYHHKALTHIKYGNYAAAFKLEDKAVELDPKYYTPYRGFLKCIFTKDYEGAISDFEKAQQLTPNSYEMDHTYPFYEGLCNLELGNYKLAEENFKEDIRIQNIGNAAATHIHFNTLLYMGILYFEMNDTARSKDYLLKCLAIYKEMPEANYYLAKLYEKENNAELKNKYLQIAKESKLKGYTLSEDNIYYAYYPHQVALYEINEALR